MVHLKYIGYINTYTLYTYWMWGSIQHIHYGGLIVIVIVIIY